MSYRFLPSSHGVGQLSPWPPMARRGAQSCGTTERSDANITALNSGRLITPCRKMPRSLRRHVVFHMETLHHSAPDNSTTTQRISPISLISPHLVLGKNQRQHVALFLNRTVCKLCSQFPVLIGSHFWNLKRILRKDQSKLVDTNIPQQLPIQHHSQVRISAEIWGPKIWTTPILFGFLCGMIRYASFPDKPI